ncbi:MAG: cell division topological specificity factor MinE [Clostridiales bacterium]
MNLFQKLWKKNSGEDCKNIAKKRLQLVLVQDRINLSNSELSLLKNDLIEVIEKYMAIDKKAMEVSLHRDGSEVAIFANIPMSKNQMRQGKAKTN